MGIIYLATFCIEMKAKVVACLVYRRNMQGTPTSLANKPLSCDCASLRALPGLWSKVDSSPNVSTKWTQQRSASRPLALSTHDSLGCGSRAAKLYSGRKAALFDSSYPVSPKSSRGRLVIGLLVAKRAPSLAPSWWGIGPKTVVHFVDYVSALGRAR